MTSRHGAGTVRRKCADFDGFMEFYIGDALMNTSVQALLSSQPVYDMHAVWPHCTGGIGTYDDDSVDDGHISGEIEASAATAMNRAMARNV